MRAYGCNTRFLAYARKISDKFEKKFAEWIDVKYAHLVNSGSSADLIAHNVFRQAEVNASHEANFLRLGHSKIKSTFGRRLRLRFDEYMR